MPRSFFGGADWEDHQGNPGNGLITVDLAVMDAAKRILSEADRPDDKKIMLYDAIRFIEVLCETIPSRELIEPALDLACELNISSTMHFTAAVNHKASLFTANKALSVAARKACRVMLLE